MYQGYVSRANSKASCDKSTQNGLFIESLKSYKIKIVFIRHSQVKLKKSKGRDVAKDKTVSPSVGSLGEKYTTVRLLQNLVERMCVFTSLISELCMSTIYTYYVSHNCKSKEHSMQKKIKEV